MAETRAIHAYLSPESYDTFADTCESNGMSVTGLLEVVGRTLPEILDARPDLVVSARRIDARRRRRGVNRE